MIELVDDRWLEENVLRQDSKPALVYVTGELDAARGHNVNLLDEVRVAVPRLTVVSVDQSAEFPEKYQVVFIPTLFLFRRGHLHSTMAGVLPRELIERAHGYGRQTSADLIEEMVRRNQEHQP